MTVQCSQAQMQEEQAVRGPATATPSSIQRPSLTRDRRADSRDSSHERIVTVEISQELLAALKVEHARLSAQANPSLSWDRFLRGLITVGLRQLEGLTDEQLLGLLQEDI
jgi:hypothetical protein